MKELLLEFQGNVQSFMIFFWLIFLGASITYLLDYIEELNLYRILYRRKNARKKMLALRSRINYKPNRTPGKILFDASPRAVF